MTTYTLAITHSDEGQSEAKAYSTATNAIDDLEGLRAGGAVISAILRDGLPIDESTLWADEEIGPAIEPG